MKNTVCGLGLGRHLLAWAAAVATLVGTASAQPEPYLRVQESDDGNQVELDVAARAFEPIDGTGPRILLVGAAHIGDTAFYRRLQYLLDAQDVVLFEGVGLGDPEAPLPEADAAELDDRTRRRARLIAAAIVGHKGRTGAYPADLEELFAAMEPGTAEMLRPLALDGAGVAMRYQTRKDRTGAVTSFVVGSGHIEMGPDDLLVRAGEGADSMAGEDGIQRLLARTLGVKFQLDAMDYSQPHWVNCDVTLSELERLLDEAGLGGEGDSFLQMMAGGGLLGAIQGPLLGMLGSSNSMREIVKLVLIDVLGKAEAMMGAMPGPMGDLMEVLLHERNDVVVARLRALVEEPGEIGSIGVFYGAAHLTGIEESLDEMGYRPVATHWVTSMVVDMERAGVDPRQARSIRGMIGRAIDQEMDRMGAEPAQK